MERRPDTNPARKGLQLGFSEQHRGVVYNRGSRRQKALKTLAILEDCLGNLNGLSALDLGCAAGNSTVAYSPSFKLVAAVDIDCNALRYARRHNGAENIGYAMMNGEKLAFPDECFDVVICAHIYEHVPNASALLAEIRRVLKPGGACFFSAGNRLSIMEPHYHLPFLSLLPRFLAHWYLRALKRGRHYYEKHLTYWQLRRLVADFELLDYTKRVVDDPQSFFGDDVIKPGSPMQRVYQFALKVAYWACPTYLWVLRKVQRPPPTVA
jgi:2-polyprenyl-3-methyl-5-hydroxy-6-metoxy-1,4-benzoquinol methylase